MLRSLLGFDWQKSPAHLLFLSKFLNPRTPEDFSKSGDWEEVLGESPRQAIKRFMDQAILTSGNLHDLLTYKFKVSELKELAKRRGLPVTGKKDDLIDQLILADGDGMRKAVGRLSVLKCSDKGREIAERYSMQEKQKREEIEKKTYDALKQVKFRDASHLVASFEAAQVFPRGIGIDWRKHDPSGDERILKVLFTSKPKFARQLDDQQLNTIRLATGMMYLWGVNDASKWIPSDFQNGLGVKNKWAVNMMHSHTVFKVTLDEFRKSSVVKAVKIANVNDSDVCEACAKLAKKQFKLHEVPELPYEHCTSDLGCRCFIRPVL